jgi:hypothetical protein
MVVIPPAKDTDAEDVVWGLQTAEALWKRGERIDAIVWLRRAAQAAGDAADDDRALELARSAAELTDWMATQPPGNTLPPSANTQQPPSYDPHNASTFVPFGDEERTGQAPLLVNNAPTYVPQAPTHVPQAPTYVPQAPQAPRPGTALPSRPSPPLASPPLASPPLSRPSPPLSRPPSSPTMQTAEPYFPPADAFGPGSSLPTPIPPSAGARGIPTPITPPVMALDEPGHDMSEEQGRGESTSVLPAEHVHAGMFNPWDEAALPAPPPSPPAAVMVPSVTHRPDGAERFEPEEEVITSVRPGQLAQQRADALAAAPSSPPAAAAKPSPPRPPPLPPRAKKPAPPAPSAPSLRAPAPPPPRVTPPPPSPTQVMAQPEPAPPPAPAPEPLAAAAADAVPAKLDLDSVDAFSDLPDDARAAFAAAAEVSALGEGEEVSSFALAYILSGTVDVAATMVDAPAARLAAGAVLRSRGTTDEGVPMRLIGVSSGVVATWTDAEVDEAFRTCPWVEEDLRTAADRMQTLVGVTIGPLGERLDASIREQIISRLTMRTLSAGEIVVTAGEQMPGLLLVGVGELELVDGDSTAGAVGSGEFLFPTEVLGGGDAPRTARAGAGGALILFGDRRVAQELLVTCPPLLEVFAGM